MLSLDERRPLFVAQTATDGEHACVQLAGELDLATIGRAADAIEQAERGGPSTLELDLSELAFMDSTGLRLMLAARQRALAADRRLVLRRGPAAVQRLFDVTALASLFEFVDE